MFTRLRVSRAREWPGSEGKPDVQIFGRRPQNFYTPQNFVFTKYYKITHGVFKNLDKMAEGAYPRQAQHE